MSGAASCRCSSSTCLSPFFGHRGTCSAARLAHCVRAARARTLYGLLRLRVDRPMCLHRRRWRSLFARCRAPSTARLAAVGPLRRVLFATGRASSRRAASRWLGRSRSARRSALRRATRSRCHLTRDSVDPPLAAPHRQLLAARAKPTQRLSSSPYEAASCRCPRHLAPGRAVRRRGHGLHVLELSTLPALCELGTGRGSVLAASPLDGSNLVTYLLTAPYTASSISWFGYSGAFPRPLARRSAAVALLPSGLQSARSSWTRCSRTSRRVPARAHLPSGDCRCRRSRSVSQRLRTRALSRTSRPQRKRD